MTTASYALFETSLGACAIAWSAGGVVGLSLPESEAGKTRKRIARRFPGAAEATPPPPVARAVEAVVGLLASGKGDLTDIALDLEALPAPDRDLYAVLRALGPGETLTYGEIAKRLGKDWTARDVGAAMGRNPIPVIIPCHRVVAANGRLGGFSAPGGSDIKRRMLAIEQAVPRGAPDLFAPAPSGSRAGGSPSP